ncbi:OLC1v1008318C1 [Oldenlandia corymbosa var. corymbosa]|nr:OLC1v1008318C1 [Oldenlandia corymbosa var. corymbosa]
MDALRMNEGLGENSYANNSLLQKKVILMTRPITEAAITELYNTISPKTLCIADLGCSSGPNTFMAIFDLIKNVDKRRKSLGLESPEYQIFLNDLPSNDFNTIFKSVPEFLERLRNEMEAGFGLCFVTGVPGSFYQRLFPTKSLHFIHSSYSLHWLSRIPEMEEANKGNIHMAISSPPSVKKAYMNQFKQDFFAFLSCRGEEMVAGGRMVLTMCGRNSEEPCRRDGTYRWEVLSMVLRDMVAEGLIEEEKLDSFNLRDYRPSVGELKHLVEMEGSFRIDRLEVYEIYWNGYDEGEISKHEKSQDVFGYYIVKCMRAVVEPLLVHHFGEEIIEEVFLRYKQIINDPMSREEKTLFVNVTVSLTKMI